MDSIVVVYGVVERPPELRFSPNGNAWCTFTVKSTARRGARSYSSYHRVVAWDGSYKTVATECAEIAPGERVLVIGDLRYRKRDDVNVYVAEINANEVERLDAAGKAEQPPVVPDEEGPEPGTDDVDGDDLPF